MTILSFFRRIAIVAPLLMFMCAPLTVGAQPADSQPAEAAMPPDEARLLADLLKDDAKRAALIDQLERAGAASTTPAPAEEVSLGRRIAETSQSALSRASASLMVLAQQISRAPAAFNTLSLKEVDLLLDALRDLLWVIVVTTIIYLGLRAALRPVFRRVGAKAAGGVARMAVTLVWTVALDVGAVLAAWGAGYLVALFVTGQAGSVGVRQALYLNAFLIAGLARVLIRAILSPSAPELRLVSAPDRGARIMARWFGVIVSTLAYGQLLIAPIAARQISAEAGAGLSTLLALISILIAAVLTLYGRRPVAAWMLGADAGRERGDGARFLAANWHLPVLIYLFGIFVVVATRPDGVIWPILISSAKVLAAIVAGVVISGVITRSIARGFSVPERLQRRLPTLEQRLNTFIPRALALARAVIVVAVAGYAISAIGVFDVGVWLSGESGARLSSALISAALILVLTFAAWIALASWVDYRLNPDFGSRPTAREQTLLSLLKNALTILLLIFTLMFILSEFAVNNAPLLAAAGGFGLAIAFGAQK
ncbi:MAG: mechanosensitive ion channel protein MscS, partial [Paracoccaceae bacterium]